MKDDDLVIETLRGALPDVVAIYRFGSTATGQAVRDSDVDIAVLPAAPLESSWTRSAGRGPFMVDDRERKPERTVRYFDEI